jgi:hypothetical protein
MEKMDNSPAADVELFCQFNCRKFTQSQNKSSVSKKTGSADYNCYQKSDDDGALFSRRVVIAGDQAGHRA